MKKTGIIILLIAVLLSLSAILVSCAKETPSLQLADKETSPFQLVDKEGTIFDIRYIKFEHIEHCQLVVVYDNVTDDAPNGAALFSVATSTSITREGSTEQLTRDDLKVGQKIRFTIHEYVISRPTDPTDYGLDRDMYVDDYNGSSKKIVILSDGE